LDFWKSPTEPGREVHVMLDDVAKKQLIEELDSRNITHSVMIEDVKKYDNITNKRLGGPKKGIWIDGGIHAREWVSPATVLYFINMRSTALSASSQLHRMFGTNYKVGTGADTLYPASGGSEDWAKGKAHVKYSYLFELRPEEQVWDGFLLSENQIMPTARETWEAVKVIASQTLAIPSVARAPQRPTQKQHCKNMSLGDFVVLAYPGEHLFAVFLMGD
ncbi:hypothetical protein TELCIR_12585, partial [Teladorsagia circumcincta]